MAAHLGYLLTMAPPPRGVESFRSLRELNRFFAAILCTGSVHKEEEQDDAEREQCDHAS